MVRKLYEGARVQFGATRCQAFTVAAYGVALVALVPAVLLLGAGFWVSQGRGGGDVLVTVLWVAALVIFVGPIVVSLPTAVVGNVQSMTTAGGSRNFDAPLAYFMFAGRLWSATRRTRTSRPRGSAS